MVIRHHRLLKIELFHAVNGNVEKITLNNNEIIHIILDIEIIYYNFEYSLEFYLFKEVYIMAQEQVGVLHEVGDLGLGFQELTEEEQKKLQQEKDKKEKK